MASGANFHNPHRIKRKWRLKKKKEKDTLKPIKRSRQYVIMTHKGLTMSSTHWLFSKSFYRMSVFGWPVGGRRVSRCISDAIRDRDLRERERKKRERKEGERLNQQIMRCTGRFVLDSTVCLLLTRQRRRRQPAVNRGRPLFRFDIPIPNCWRGRRRRRVQHDRAIRV